MPALGKLVSFAEQDTKARVAAQAIHRKIALIDGSDCRHAGALSQRDERGIGVVARQACVAGNDAGELRVINDRLDPQQLRGTRTLEPGKRRMLMRGSRGMLLPACSVL